ncbi:MAG: hypothetical protein WCF19_00560 [Chlamydiales bacterium]
MSLGVQNTATRIDQNWMDSNRNEKYGQPLLSRVIDYTGTPGGISNGIKLTGQISSAIGATGVAAGAGQALGVFGIVRLPSALRRAYDALMAAQESHGEDDDLTQRQTTKAVGETMGALTAVGNTINFVGAANPMLGTLTKITDFGDDVADLTVAYGDYNKAVKLEEDTTGPLKKVVTHSKHYYWLCVVKAFMSIASAFAALIMFLSGVQLLPVIAMTLFSLSTTLLSIRKDLFKDEGEHRIISFASTVTI